MLKDPLPQPVPDESLGYDIVVRVELTGPPDRIIPSTRRTVDRIFGDVFPSYRVLKIRRASRQ